MGRRKDVAPTVYLLCGECGASPPWSHWKTYDAETREWGRVGEPAHLSMLKCPSCEEIHSKIPEDAGVWGVGTYMEMQSERRRLEQVGLARWVNYYPERRRRAKNPRFIVTMHGGLTFKQRQVLALYALGFGRRQVLSNLGLLRRTLNSREESLMKNLGVTTIREAVDVGRIRGIVA